ncbi:MAG: 30S ribosome-binding factor RbfA [Rhodocyclaceae bacterium]|nr:30S ribosome-binding factor RbfA [Rhodocyclaceae bacterium]
MNNFSRSDRVNEQIHRELSELLRQVKDPRIAQLLPLVTLTGVEVSPDYAHAKVFYTSLAEADRRRDIDRGLRHAAGFLRRELGRRIRIHHLPELHFVFDASVERGTHLSQLIDEAVESDRRHDE